MLASYAGGCKIMVRVVAADYAHLLGKYVRCEINDGEDGGSGIIASIWDSKDGSTTIFMFDYGMGFSIPSEHAKATTNVRWFISNSDTVSGQSIETIWG